MCNSGRRAGNAPTVPSTEVIVGPQHRLRRKSTCRINPWADSAPPNKDPKWTVNAQSAAIAAKGSTVLTMSTAAGTAVVSHETLARPGTGPFGLIRRYPIAVLIVL